MQMYTPVQPLWWAMCSTQVVSLTEYARFQTDVLYIGVGVIELGLGFVTVVSYHAQNVVSLLYT